MSLNLETDKKAFDAYLEKYGTVIDIEVEQPKKVVPNIAFADFRKANNRGITTGNQVFDNAQSLEEKLALQLGVSTNNSAAKESYLIKNKNIDVDSELFILSQKLNEFMNRKGER